MSGRQFRLSGVVADERLFADLYASLRRFAAVVGASEDDPDDLVQEAVARTLRWHRLSELEDPGAYLRTVIVRLVSNQRRSLGRRRTAFGRLRGSAGSVAAAPVYGSDLDLFQSPPQDRAVLWLSVVEEMPLARVAAVLGCSERAVRMRKHRALRRLRALIEEASDD
jgi:DNA-directed RNA polymerase specialized sigma24 family protein